MFDGHSLRRLPRLIRDVLQSAPEPRRPAGPAGTETSDCPGDYRGEVRYEYRPHSDSVADPGEVVWAWVPFEDNPSLGKDRPALIIGRDGSWLLALQVTSQDHDLDAAQEARQGRFWVDIGTGGWDTRGRASEVRVDRVIRLATQAVRRTGARLPRERFDQVTAEVSRHR